MELARERTELSHGKVLSPLVGHSITPRAKRGSAFSARGRISLKKGTGATWSLPPRASQVSMSLP